MRQIYFLGLIVIFAALAFFRPVYSLGSVHTLEQDFENIDWVGAGNNSHTLTDEEACSGSHSSKLDSGSTYGYIFQVNADYLGVDFIGSLKVKANILVPLLPKGLYLVCQSQRKEQAPLFWSATKVIAKPGYWTRVEADINVNKKLSPGDEISVYFWNKEGKETVFIDDVQITYY